MTHDPTGAPLEPLRVLSCDLPDAGATHEFGVALGRVLVAGDTLALVGPLGAGKTHLARGIAAGLEVPSDAWITSPTFTLMAQFPCREGTFYHLDLYRLGHESALWELGFFDVLHAGGVVAVEWWDHFLDTLLPSTLLVKLAPVPDRPDARTLEIWTLPADGWEDRAARLRRLRLDDPCI